MRAGSKAWRKIGHRWAGASVRIGQAAAGAVEVLVGIAEAVDSCRRAGAEADVADSSSAERPKVFQSWSEGYARCSAIGDPREDRFPR